MRIMGLLLTAIAVQFAIDGFKDWRDPLDQSSYIAAAGRRCRPTVLLLGQQTRRASQPRSLFRIYQAPAHRLCEPGGGLFNKQPAADIQSVDAGGRADDRLAMAIASRILMFVPAEAVSGAITTLARS